jgi:hypothetical protein
MQRKIQKTVHFLPGIFYIYQGFASENADYYTGFCSSYLKYKTEAFFFQKIFFQGGPFSFPITLFLYLSRLCIKMFLIHIIYVKIYISTLFFKGV